MRSLLVSFAVIALLGGASSAQAEKRIFIIANNADSYRAERCLAKGEKCGAAVAEAYCKSRDFERALSYRKVGRQEITGGVPISGPECGGGQCEEFVAIECAR